MPIPDFIRDLRAHVGDRELWLSGVSVVVLDDAGRLLLTRRVDNGQWAVVSGVLEPGEEPARAALREVREETSIIAEIDRLTSIDVTPLITYPNGDRTRYLDVCFLAHHVEGEPHAADDENSDVAWFAADDLPADLTDTSRLRIEKALSGDAEAWFRR
ncbi:NUDIX domain-containing protein [Gordonia sp. zg691]|uniref:NUDIX domain-containing protein n=1 Tax=Gordonia jinghuaiqii TaxID=2758710 RepID=A0A7D7R1P3_9ACTN|nr:NUDIX domain-containing protein [Gordonia jinghuaiqii]MBD0860818.1 NUDIX domain-containing protein [Gordonia jinghuaiqii]MCR5979621.1 NUDIX domain-containing protein [Gordonia jinghuaiqii]QMT00592.1 NUDIX domain-containing protein [Gordonia jinghuaiqii]